MPSCPYCGRQTTGGKWPRSNRGILSRSAEPMPALRVCVNQQKAVGADYAREVLYLGIYNMAPRGVFGTNVDARPG